MSHTLRGLFALFALLAPATAQDPGEPRGPAESPPQLLRASTSGDVVLIERVDAWLMDGRLDEAADALRAHLGRTPDDDAARFALGWTRVLQAIEGFAASAYQHGLGLDALDVMPVLGSTLPVALPRSPEPLPTTHADSRRMVQDWVDDLAAALEMLEAIDDPHVALTLTPAQFMIRPVDDVATPLLPEFASPLVRRGEVEPVLRVRFDRADAHWLAGYCHLASAPAEAWLATDTSDTFERAGHALFPNAVTSCAWFVDHDQQSYDIFNDVSDLIALIHTARLPVVAPERMRASLAHLEAMFACSRAMWACIEAETDDELEWVPSPTQTGPLGATIDAERMESWRWIMAEAERLVAGETLLPFWRGPEDDPRGVNLRRVFTEPTLLDPVLWFQGSAAVPYLETGTITPLADGDVERDLRRVFEGNLLGFALWVN